MKKKIISLLVTILVMFSISGCAATNTQIAYTVYPIGYIIQRLAGNTINSVTIQNNTIVQRSEILSNYDEILSNSSILINIGQLEPYLSVYSTEISKLIDKRLDLSNLNAIYTFKRYTPIITDEEVTYIEGPYYKGELFEMIDTNTKDLFLWLDPIAMLSMSKDIKEYLITTYPDDKNIFEENYKLLETDLVRIDAAYQSLATKVASSNKEIKFVSMSASFGNWQKTYGIQLYPVILSKYGALPNDEQLEIIKNRIIADNVQYIVYEPNMTSDMIALFNQLQEELNLTRVELSNLSSLTTSQESEGKDYLSIMYENLSVLETMAIEKTSSITPTEELEEEIEEENIDLDDVEENLEEEEKDGKKE
ncbi:MAG: zinc ABC transporter solute-binding protein [Erysipelotrichaceae bacterium]|nr:zinc ABC transporter solute-binding protein [Erysipelotrichaceae bacterium]